MRAQAARRLYAHVDGAERFRLLLKAFSRGDVNEADHLLESAPRVPVAARDPAFVEAGRRFTALHARFDRAANAMLGWLVLLDHIEPFVSNLVAEAQSAEARTYAELLRANLDEARHQALSQIKGLVQVLDELGSEQLGMSAEAILAVPWPGCVRLLQGYRAAVDGATVNPGDLPAMRAELECRLVQQEAVDAVS